MKTFEKVLEIFREYLDCDLEEEVLPCREGYLRVTWNGDSRYCVDGLLSRTPDELFEVLLSDYRSYEELRLTKGCREVTEEDSLSELSGTMEGGRKMRAIWFILKLPLKILMAPVILSLTLFVWICVGIVYVSGLVLGLISMVVALLGVAVLITYSLQNGIILLVIAFLISPYGLPMAAIWLLGKVQDLKFIIQDLVYG